MPRFAPSEGTAQQKNKPENDGKFKSNKVKKAWSKKKSNKVLKGANTWRDVSDKPEKSREEIENAAKENFEKKKLFKFNEKGEKIKEFAKQGAVRPWLDLKFEENDKMTFYSGFFVKKEDVEQLDNLKLQLEGEGLDKKSVNRKMMKAIRKSKRELFKEVLYEEKLAQIKSGTYKGPVKVWNKKKNDTDAATNDTKDTTVPVKSAEKPKDPEVKKSADTIEGLDLNFDFVSVSDEDEGECNANDGSVPMDFNGIPYKFVETDMAKLDAQSDEPTDDESDDDMDHSNTQQPVVNDNSASRDPDTEANSSNTAADEAAVPAAKKSIVYEENKLMTCVDGFWIRRTCLLQVDELRLSKKKEIIAARTKNKENPALTKHEENELKKKMKFDLNRMANQLRTFLQKKAKKQAAKPPKPKTDKPESKKKNSKKNAFQKGQFGTGKPAYGNKREYGDRTEYGNRREYGNSYGNNGGYGGYESTHQSAYAERKALQYAKNRDSSGNLYNKNVVTNPDKPGMVRFDGYWIKQEAAERLRELKNKLKAEGVATERIAEVMKQERRREENDVKHERKTVCFSCRQPGHVVADCPLKQNTAGVGACFKCGSLEHQSSSCFAKSSSEGASNYSYATCFICRQKGHISRECPKNQRGLYPDGGGCTLCDSNQHLIKDCPRNANEQRDKPVELTAGVIRPGQLLEVMEDDVSANNVPLGGATNKKSKLIRF